MTFNNRLGEARGWRSGIRAGVQRALIILLSGHVEGDIVFYSAMSSALRALDLSCNRTADVLDQRGILLDDRRPCFEDWLDGKLDGITPGIAREVQTRRIPGRTQIRQKGATVTISPGQRAQGRLRRAW
jgi:hypothetical protein